MPRCDFVNARVRGRRGRLLGVRGARSLLSEPDLSARLALLRRSRDYAPAVPPPSERDPLAAFEAGLHRLAVEEAVDIGRAIEGGAQRELFGAVLLFDDLASLQTLFRGLEAGRPADALAALVAPAPGLPDALLVRAAASGSVPGALDVLARASVTWAAALEASRRQYEEHGLPGLEAGVVRAASGAARARADRHRGRDAEIARRWLTLRTDLNNAARLLELDSPSDAAAAYVEGGAALPFEAFARFGALAPRERREAVARWGRRVGLGPAERLASPARAELAFSAALALALGRLAVLEPLSVAVPIAFVLERRRDSARVRMALRAAEAGLAPSELFDLLEQ